MTNLDFTTAKKLYTELKTPLETKDEIVIELWSDLITSASNYAQIRNEWETMTTELKELSDSSRTSKHNRFMDSLEIYVRNVNKLQNLDLSLEVLGDRKTNRQIWGDLSGYIMLFGVLNNQ